MPLRSGITQPTSPWRLPGLPGAAVDAQTHTGALGTSSTLSLVVSTHGSASSKNEESFRVCHEAFTESIRKRQVSIQEKLDSTIHNGATRDLIKYETERDFTGLIEEFVQWEKRLDAETMKREGER
jgi:hypothetical protein